MQKSDYSFGDKILHRMALGISFISEFTFDIETMKSKNVADVSGGKHIFISGLARAGTTILMRSFYETNQFTSLTYRDMPFVLMPGLWKQLSRSSRKQSDLKERAHGDGIMVGFDSPEAFEEVFWRTFTGREYIFDSSLRPYNADDEIIKKFQQYISHIISSADEASGLRYLSKNNNNILRLNAIQKACPNSLILLAFRDPVQHAISLFNQHKKFCIKHANDKFSYDYMRWLGHHEFGGTHKPFIFSENTEDRLKQYSEDDINYWLIVWIETYLYLLSSAPSNSNFVCYESLCKNPNKVLSGLYERAGLSFEEGKIDNDYHAPPSHVVDNIDNKLVNEAMEIYSELLNKTD